MALFLLFPAPVPAQVAPDIESACDGLDNDGDGLIDEGFADTDADGQADCVDADDDGDGYDDSHELALGSDPLDGASVPEVCDGLDNDGDGVIDNGFADTSGDGIPDCTNDDHLADGTCDDPHPAVDEALCDGVDHDMDGVEDCLDADDDGDGYDDKLEVELGTDPTVPTDCSLFDLDADGVSDCDDPDDDDDGYSDLQERFAGTDPHVEDIHPETCDDGIDDDCDNQVNESCDEYADVPGGTGVTVSPAAGVDITFDDVQAAGAVRVSGEKPAGALPEGYRMGRAGSYYEIATDAAFTGTAEVCVTYDPADFSGENGLSLLHLGSSGWEDITTGVSKAANTVCGVTTGFSPFVVAQQQTVLVTLDRLEATSDGTRVELAWTTAAEIDNAGFHLLRGTTANGPFARLNDRLIPAQGNGIGGAVYHFTDAGVEPGGTYYYKLQDVENTGLVTDHGPLAITVEDGASATLFELDNAAGGGSPATAGASGNDGFGALGGCAAQVGASSWGDAAGLLVLLAPAGLLFRRRRARRERR